MRTGAIIFLFVIIVSLLAIGCTSYRGAVDQTSLGIVADRLNYTPLMSSTVGIGLTPEYPVALNRSIEFAWHADYGYFVSWAAPNFKVNYLGTDITRDDTKVYWSYSPDDMDKEKPPVHITLTMIDRISGLTLNRTGLDIVRENGHIATVKH